MLKEKLWPPNVEESWRLPPSVEAKPGTGFQVSEMGPPAPANSWKSGALRVLVSTFKETLVGLAPPDDWTALLGISPNPPSTVTQFHQLFTGSRCNVHTL